MPTGVFKTTNVPQDKLAQVVAGYMLDNPVKVEKVKQPDGKWTVIATFSETETDFADTDG